MKDGEHASRHVQDEHGNHEGGEAAGTLVEKGLVLGFDGPKTADTRADVDSDLVPIRLIQVQAGVFQGFVSGHDGEFDEPIGPALVFRGRKGVAGIEFFDLCRDLGVERGRIELRNAGNPAFTVKKVGPKRGYIQA